MMVFTSPKSAFLKVHRLDEGICPVLFAVCDEVFGRVFAMHLLTRDCVRLRGNYAEFLSMGTTEVSGT